MNMSDIRNKGEHLFEEFIRLRVLLFVSLLVVLYGFIIWRVNIYVKAQPSPSAVASRSEVARRPRIDQSTVDKINKLQDNSVNVQTLFDQARQNPFQE